MVAAKVRLPSPCLCLVTDRALCPDGTLAERVAEAVEGGVQMVQLREKDLPGGELLRLARDLKYLMGRKAIFIVNERVDVALACGAHGVHLGEMALPVKEARRMVGDGMLVGRSVHSLQGGLQARRDGADYLIVGTVFETASKPGKRPEGPALLRQVARAVELPVLAIGGVKASNLPRVMEAGARGAAVVSAILAASDPRAAAQELAQAMAGVPQAQPIR